MHLRGRRIVGGVVLSSLMTGVIYLEFYLTPPEFFSSPVYWLGLGVYTLAGWIFVTKPNKTWKYFGGGVMVTGLAVATASEKVSTGVDIRIRISRTLRRDELANGVPYSFPKAIDRAVSENPVC